MVPSDIALEVRQVQDERGGNYPPFVVRLSNHATRLLIGISVLGRVWLPVWLAETFPVGDFFHGLSWSTFAPGHLGAVAEGQDGY